MPRAVEPPPTRWTFPDPLEAGRRRIRDSEIVGLGADLEPGTVLAAYRNGLFPMPIRRGVVAWWSPDPRGIIPLEGLVISRSLRKACARFDIRIDTAFEDVLEACADRTRPGAWIDHRIKEAYLRLHHMGWVHSVEAWCDGALAGGLYGVSIGGLFAGESMFHRRTDASKVALVGLVERLREEGATLLDIQWATDHLQTLGAITIPRSRYQALLARALELPQPPTFGGPRTPGIIT